MIAPNATLLAPRAWLVEASESFMEDFLVGAITRRKFLYGAAAGSAALTMTSAFAAKTKVRKIHIGHTGITWRNDQVDDAIAAIASLGYYGFETFGDVLTKREDTGGIGQVLSKNNLPLISGYCTVNLTEPSVRDAEMAKADKWCGLI